MISHRRAIAGTGNSSRFVSRAGWIAGALIAAMIMAFTHDASAAPSFSSAGGVASGTGSITVNWPTHATNDIGLLIIENDNNVVTLGANAADWTLVTNSPQGTGTTGGTGATATR